MFSSSPNEYEIKTELSSCCFGIGTVYLTKHRPSQQFVALKKFQMDKAKEESNLIRVCHLGSHDKSLISHPFSPFAMCTEFRRKFCQCVNSIHRTYCHCTQPSSTNWMCTWYRRLCVTIRAAMQWTPTFPPVRQSRRFTSVFEAVYHFLFTFRFSWDYSLSYSTWCTSCFRIFTQKRFHTSIDSGQPYFNQSLESRFVWLSRNDDTRNAWRAYTHTIRFAIEEC